jgi:hypothetical protein
VPETSLWKSGRLTKASASAKIARYLAPFCCRRTIASIVQGTPRIGRAVRGRISFSRGSNTSQWWSANTRTPSCSRLGCRERMGTAPSPFKPTLTDPNPLSLDSRAGWLRHLLGLQEFGDLLLGQHAFLEDDVKHAPVLLERPLGDA